MNWVLLFSLLRVRRRLGKFVQQVELVHFGSRFVPNLALIFCDLEPL